MTVDEIVCPSTPICGTLAWLRLAAAAREYPAGHAVPSPATLLRIHVRRTSAPFRWLHGRSTVANTSQHHAAVAMRRSICFSNRVVEGWYEQYILSAALQLYYLFPFVLYCTRHAAVPAAYSQGHQRCISVSPPLRSACAILSSKSLWPSQLC